MAEQITQHKELFKRFIPHKQGLGYVESSSENCVQPSARSPRDPKTTCSEGIQVAYIDQKITQLFEKLQSSTSQEIDFAKRKVEKPFRPSH